MRESMRMGILNSIKILIRLAALIILGIVRSEPLSDLSVADKGREHSTR